MPKNIIVPENTIAVITDKNKVIETTQITSCCGLAFFSENKTILAHIANMDGYPVKDLDENVFLIESKYRNSKIFDVIKESYFNKDQIQMISVFGIYNSNAYGDFYDLPTTQGDLDKSSISKFLKGKFEIDVEINFLRGPSIYYAIDNKVIDADMYDEMLADGNSEFNSSYSDIPNFPFLFMRKNNTCSHESEKEKGSCYCSIL